MVAHRNTKGTATMSDFIPAKRGFVAVTTKMVHRYMMHTGSFMQLTIEVGLVSSVSRDGKVKRVESLNHSGTKTPRDWDEVTIINPSRFADLAGFLAECKTRQSTAPGEWRPFTDLNDVRETARKYVAAVAA